MCIVWRYAFIIYYKVVLIKIIFTSFAQDYTHLLRGKLKTKLHTVWKVEKMRLESFSSG